MKNATTQKLIDTLNPTAKLVFTRFINEIESPVNGNLMVVATSAFRDEQKEAQVLKSGGDAPKNIKRSLHSFGFSVDLNIVGTDKQGKKISLTLRSPENSWLPYVGIANKYGIRWGGYYKNTPIPDRVHFSYTNGFTSEKQFIAYLDTLQKDKQGFAIIPASNQIKTA